MEGYLQKKARGEKTGIFTRRNWTKRWFVLEGNFLEYYEQFDSKLGKPVNKKETIAVKDCEMKVSGIVMCLDQKLMRGVEWGMLANPPISSQHNQHCHPAPFTSRSRALLCYATY